MQMLKDAILERGKALNQDILLVDSFQIIRRSTLFMKAVGETFAEHFDNRGITSGDDRKFRHCAHLLLRWRWGFQLVIMKKQTSCILNGDLLCDNGAFLYKGDGVSTVRKARVLECRRQHSAD